MTVQVVNGQGELSSEANWFEEDERLGDQSIKAVSVLGAQGSGKSTLMNEIFGTEFDVAKKGALGSATTKGVAAAKAKDDELVLILDVEGADARERGSAGKNFVKKCAGFAAAISDVVIVNMWYHDLGRVDSASYTCLESIFSEQAQALTSGGSIKSALVFAVRDVDEDVSEADVEKQLLSDAQEAWKRVNGPGSVEDVFDMDFLPFRHIRYSAEDFKAQVDIVKKRFLDSSATGYYFQQSYSKTIPAEALAAYAGNLWTSLYEPAPAAVPTEIAAGSGDAVAKCDTAFSFALQAAQSEIATYATKLDEGETVSGFGEISKKIYNDATETYANATAEFENDPSVIRKRDELDAILDTTLKAQFVKLLQLLREKALATFRSGITDESPPDFVFFRVDTWFVREADQAVLPGSKWSYESERNFLQKLMEELVSQQKKISDVQMTAAQETQQAFRYLQMQEGRIHQIQQQHYGGVSGSWNVGAAYRPPDSNVNISVGYMQGKTNIQISMVPDEQASLLGPNGFTAGVGPANLGLSFNINV